MLGVGGATRCAGGRVLRPAPCVHGWGKIVCSFWGKSLVCSPQCMLRVSMVACTEDLHSVIYHYVEVVDVCIGPNVTRCYRCPISTSTFAFMKAIERCNFGGE